MRHHEIAKDSKRLRLEQPREPRIMSNSETQKSIDEWYRDALSADDPPYWLEDGHIIDWNGSAADWLSCANLPPLQLLDGKWKSFAITLHFIKALDSEKARLEKQASVVSRQLFQNKLDLARAIDQVEKYISSSRQHKSSATER